MKYLQKTLIHDKVGSKINKTNFSGKKTFFSRLQSLARGKLFPLKICLCFDDPKINNKKKKVHFLTFCPM